MKQVIDKKADSLMNQSENKKIFARQQERIANADIKQGYGDKKMKYTGKNGLPIITPSAKERIEMAKKARESATRDSFASVAIGNRLKSMKKK